MRRPTLLPAAGLLAYFIGATVRVYNRPDGLCGRCGAGRRVLAVAVEHPRAALSHPLAAARHPVAPFCSD